MNRCLAVVGTDTGVGKTVVSALLAASASRHGAVAYWKPVATGALEDRDAATVARLAGPGVEILPETYLFPAPLSPHLAARLVGAVIDPRRVLGELETYRNTDCGTDGKRLIVEGVGGLLVPWTDSGYLLADFLVAAGLPSLLVARSTLGTINHTLLTLEALRARALPLAGVVLVGPPNAENRRAVERFGVVPVIAEVPPLALDPASFDPLAFDPSSFEAAARGFDPEGLAWRSSP